MTEPLDDSLKNDPPERHLQQDVGSKAERRIRARRERSSVWFGLGMFGIIGWSIAVPTVLGIMSGLWIDRHWPSPVSWTLTLLFIGIVLGCMNAWRWVKRESHRH